MRFLLRKLFVLHVLSKTPSSRSLLYKLFADAFSKSGISFIAQWPINQN